jgi:hypothetical protein
MGTLVLVVVGLLLGGWSLFQLWIALTQSLVWGWPRPARWTRQGEPVLFWSLVGSYLLLVTLFVITPIVGTLRALGISI